MASTTGNGNGQKSVDEAQSDLADVLKDLRKDITALKTDLTILKDDGALFGAASLRSARDTAEGALAEAKERTVHKVRTVEEDIAEVATDIAQTVQRNPYTTIGVAVLGGMLLSSLFKKD